MKEVCFSLDLIWDTSSTLIRLETRNSTAAIEPHLDLLGRITEISLIRRLHF